MSCTWFGMVITISSCSISLKKASALVYLTSANSSRLTVIFKSFKLLIFGTLLLQSVSRGASPRFQFWCIWIISLWLSNFNKLLSVWPSNLLHPAFVFWPLTAQFSHAILLFCSCYPHRTFLLHMRIWGLHHSRHLYWQALIWAESSTPLCCKLMVTLQPLVLHIAGLTIGFSSVWKPIY